jgi:hydrogenase maturation protein HypF
MDIRKILDAKTGVGAGRLSLTVRGRVQGVGFRPSIYRMAAAAGLAGSVRNTRRGVVIEIEGARDAILSFASSLEKDLPPLARIDSLEAERVEPAGDAGFVIIESEEAGGSDALYPVDTSVCDDCLREMRDPGDPRFRYPFINCTNCGPRFTIIEGLPYDRPLTTMSEFEMDGLCSGQYLDPADRRFHAEPISCPGCGPSLSLIDADRKVIPGDPVDVAKRLLAAGKILAIKGLGGYHLACLADSADAVSTLRERKKRPAKPFAVMFRDIGTLEIFCEVGEVERRLLLSPEAPIVLLRNRGADLLPAGIAPGNGFTGAFLPYTPLHHLIMEDFDGLVMTSANFTDEPLISTEDELGGILGAIADAALVNDRRISHKCDDSIFFVPGGIPVPVRRARGFVPEPLPISPGAGVSILGLGGQAKGTFTMTRGDAAFVSPHLGDLGDYRSQKNYRNELVSFEKMLGVSPSVIVRDMHPDYFTSRLAGVLGADSIIEVQHHHAHAVSVMAEYGISEPVIGISFDGTGYGGDGTLWGGEFLLARPHDFRRLAHLKNVPLPGGERAVMEPWRMALMYLRELFGKEAIGSAPAGLKIDDLPAEIIMEMADRNINSMPTSSAGRLFDAVASLLGLGLKVSYEAQAAIALESLAFEAGRGEMRYRFGYGKGHPMEIDAAPVIAGILEDIGAGVETAVIAAAFHESTATMIVDTAVRLAGLNGCTSAVISGGVFQNRLLCERVMELSSGTGYEFLMHRTVPPNDGGISLGQVQIAAARIERGAL